MRIERHLSLLPLCIVATGLVRASIRIFWNRDRVFLPGKTDVVCQGVIDSNASYGADVSFPYQHHEFSTLPTPFGDSQQKRYQEYMQGCRDKFKDNAFLCYQNEDNRIEKNLNQPQLLQNFTETGFKKIRAPQKLWALLDKFWEENQGAESLEWWDDGDIFINHWASPTDLLDLPKLGGSELVREILEAARPVFEGWIGQELGPARLYGAVIYKDGAVMSPHLDREGDVASAIINLAQDLDEPWMLEVLDHDGKAQNITMETGR